MDNVISKILSKAWWVLAGTLALLNAAAGAPADPLTTLDYRIDGQAMMVTPSALSVPKGIAGSVGVSIPGEIPSGAFVEATLRGPSFPARRLVGQPNAPLLLPPLSLSGDYSLDGIRLVSASGETLLEANPSTVPVRVFEEVLVSRVTSRSLSLDEIADRGIVIDKSNFRALEFEVGFVIDGQTFPVKFPVITPQFTQPTEIIPAAELEERLAQVDKINQQLASEVKLPDGLETVNPNIQVMPFHIQRTTGGADDLALSIPPIPALMVIPGNVGFLNQFFSVQIFTENGAPNGSGLSVRDVSAELILPVGPDRVAGTFAAPGDDPVRFARVGASAEIRNVIPVRAVGPDGQSGTEDDVERLQPGQAGQGEFLVEGLQEGLHILDLKLKAKLDGLAAGSVEVEGRAAGSVQVSNPKFSLAFSHPRTVRAGEPYEASVTVLNTSNTVANLVSISLNSLNVSGGVLETPERVELGTIRPGETGTASYRIRSQRTGEISFSNITTSDDSLVGRFRLRVGVDERGVSLSRNTLLLPDFIDFLPEEVVRAANRVLGQAMGVVSAAQLPPGVQRAPRSFVSTTTRVIEGKTIRSGGGIMVQQLAEAAERVRYGESLATVLPDLQLDWQGGRDFSPGWDQIIRTTDAGREWREALMRAMENVDPAPDHPVTRLVQSVGNLAGRGESWCLAAVSRGVFQGAAQTATLTLTNAKGVAGTESSTLEKAVGYGGREGSLLASSTPGVFEWKFIEAFPGPIQLSVVKIETDGTARELLWSLADLAAGACAHFDSAGTGADLQVDDNCDGTVDRVIAGRETPFTEVAPEVLKLRQDPELQVGRPDKKCFPVTTTNDLGNTVSVENYGNIVALLFNKPMTQETAGNPEAYQLDDGNRAASVQVQPGGRVALLALRRPIGALIPHTLTIGNGVTDLRGNTLAATPLIIQSRLAEGFKVRGRILRPDGSPGQNLPVTLTYNDKVPSSDGCRDNEVRVAQVSSDGDGAFALDFVLSGIPFSLSTTDVTDVRDNEAIAIILESSVDGAVTEARLKSLGAGIAGSELSANAALRRAFGVESISQAIALAEGLDRAVVRDFAPAGRQGEESVYVLRFRGRAAVSGQVLLADGVTPVAGAAVNLFPDPDSRELGRGVLSDSNGTFSFLGVPLGTTSVEATSATGLTRTVSTLVATSGATVNLPILLSANVPERVTVQGRITEPDGAPHGSATVLVQTTRPEGGADELASVAIATSDANGYYSANDIPVGGRVRVAAISSDGRRKGERTNVALAAGGVNTVNVTLQARATVRGRVEFANGDPVPGAIVGGGEVLVTTDALGAFTLPGVPTGPRSVSAGLEADKDQTDPRRQMSRTGSASLNVLPGDDNFVVIRFNPAGRIAGVVLDEDGAIVPNTDVAIPLDRGTEEESFFAWVKTDAEGKFVFDNFGLGTWNLSTPAPPHDDPDKFKKAQQQIATGDLDQVIAGLKTAFAAFTGASDPFLNGEGESFRPDRWGVVQNVQLEFDGQTVVVPVKYLKKATISGTVRNGQEVPIGARVRLTGIGPRPNGYPATTIRGELNSDPALGSFSFDGNAFVGDWGLQAASPFFGVVVSAAGRTTPDLPVASGILLQFPPVRETNGSLSGLVLQADGSPAGADVRVQISFGPDFVVRTDASGRFATTAGTFTLPAGGYTVTALDEGTGATGQVSVAVTAGQDNAVTVPLLGRGDARVTVRKADGTPASGAAVEIQGGQFPRERFNGVAGPDGTVVFSNVFAGPYSSCASLTIGGTRVAGRASMTVSAGAGGDAVITLGGTGTVRGQFVRADGVTPIPFGNVSLSGLAVAPTNANGRFELPDVPLGTFRITATDDQTARSGFATVVLSTVNQVVEVRIVETPLGTVEGLVLSGLGSLPVPNAEVKMVLDDSFASQRTRTVTTGPDGAFSFSGVPPGGLRLDALDPLTLLRGSVRGSMPSGAGTATVNIPLQSTANLTVNVFEPDGVTPATAVTVKMGALSADTDAEGRVRFENVKLLNAGASVSQHYRILATDLTLGSTRSFGYALFYPVTQGGEEQVSITLRGVGTIEGQVFLGDGVTPAPGAQVEAAMPGTVAVSGLTLSTPFSGQKETIIADGAGRFRLENVPVGPVGLAAFSLTQGAQKQISLITPGSVVTQDLILSASGTVAGRIVRPDGTTPAAGAEVFVRFTSASNADGAILAISGEDGRFSISPVTVGLFTVNVTLLDTNGLAKFTGTLTANGEIFDVDDLVLDEDFPTVVSTVPASTTENANINAPVEILFSEALDPATVEASGIFLRPTAGGLIVPATLVLTAPAGESVNRLVRLTPLAPLQSSTAYQLVIVDGELLNATGQVTNRGPRDLVGRALPALFSATFQTRDQRSPGLLSFTPATGSEQVDVTGTVRLSFDEPVQPGAEITVTGPSGPVPGKTSLGVNSTVLTFVPQVFLLPNSVYSVRVSGVQDLAGNPLAGQPLLSTFATLDTLGPVFSDLRIKNTQVPTAGSRITLEAVLASPEAGARFRLSANAVTVATSAPDVFEIPVTLPASGNIVFRAIGIDRFGNEGPLTELTVSVLPNTPPVITLARLNPASGPVATGSAVSVRISASDDSGITELKAAMTGAATAALKTTAGSDITLAGVVKSTASGEDVITIIAQATDTSGIGTGEQSFTIPLRDGTAPTLVLDGAVPGGGFAPGAVVTIPVRGRDNFGVARYTVAASGTVTGETEIPVEPAAKDDLRTLTFTMPSDAPITGEAFTLTLRAVDSAGLVSAPLTASLRTSDLTPPQVTALSPVAGATNQTTRPALTITFDEALDPSTVSPANVRLVRDADSSSIPTTASLNAAGTVITLTPVDLPLEPNTAHRLVATTGLTDTSGNALAAEASGLFRTAQFQMTAPLADAQVVEGQTLTVATTETFSFISRKARFFVNEVADGADDSSAPFERTVTVPSLSAVPGGILPLRVDLLSTSDLLLARSSINVLVSGIDDDSDSDGLTNGQEIAAGSDAFRSDADEDPDGDGLTNAQEVAAGTKANKADSDDDFLNDGAEVAAGTNPLNPDTDSDGILDGLEALFGTSPLLADTDGDTLSDGFELGIGRITIISDAPRTWIAAKADAESRGGHLLTIGSAAENLAFVTFFGANPATAGAWIGHSDRFIEGSFRPVNGEFSTFTNFGPGEPSNTNNEDAVQLRSDVERRWNDAPETGFTAASYILETGFFSDPTLADTDGDTLRDDVDPFIGEANATPLAGDDGFFRDAGEVLVLNIAADLLANDSDPDGEPLGFDSFTQPNGGTITQPNSGALVFTPDPGFDGVAAFEYTVIDAGGLSATATVSVTVGMNTRPVAGTSGGGSSQFALRFDGVDDFVQSALTAAQDLAPASAWTIEAWVKPTATNHLAFPVIYSQGNWRASLGFNASNGKFDSWVNNTAQITSTAPAVALDDWMHVALAFDGTTRRFIVNGVEAGAFASGAVTGDGQPVRIGAAGNSSPNTGSFFRGTINEVRVWKRALSAGEIAENSTRSLLGTEADLAAYWPFEEGVGSVTADASGQSPAASLGSSAATSPEWVASDSPVSSFGQSELSTVDTPVLLLLQGFDADGNPLTARVLSLPTRGRLFQFTSGAAGAEITTAGTTVTDPQRRVIYQPDAGFVGADGFQFDVSDGALESLPARLGIKILPSFALAGDDVWSTSSGSTMTATSALADGSSAANAFEGTPLATVFADGQSAGFTHFLEWQTPTTVRIDGARLLATDQGPASAARGFSEMRLFGRLDGAAPFTLLATYRAPENPYFGALQAEIAVETFVGTQFRAEFDAAVAGSGPQLGELDAIGETVVMAPGKFNPVSLQNATATFSQGGFPAGSSIDGNTSNGGWAINSGPTPQTIVWETTNNIPAAADTQIAFDFIQNFGGAHFLGAFRISATTDARSEFADGLTTGGDVSANWVVLDPILITSTGGETFTVREDKAVVVTGVMPSATTHTIRYQGIIGDVTGFRLEMLNDPALGGVGGPGRTSHGNFVLTEVVAKVRNEMVFNRAPRGTDDGVLANQDFPQTTGNLLANDSDPEGDAIVLATIDAVSAQGGTVVHDGGGIFTYTPPPGFSGSDSFTYRITDGLQTSQPVMVTVTVQAASIVAWINPAGGAWTTASNWFPARVPAPTDTARIDLPGTYTVTLSSGTQTPVAFVVGGAGVTATLNHNGGTLAPSASSRIESGSRYLLAGGTSTHVQTFNVEGEFAFSAGSLGGAAAVNVMGLFNWSAGTLAAGGELVIGNGATANILSGSTKGLNRVFRNRGTVGHVSAESVIFNLFGSTTARIENESSGVWVVDGEGDYPHSSGGTNAFNNAGSFVKRGGTTSFSSFVPFNNTGSVAVESGVLQFNGGGINDGAFAVAVGGALQISTGTFTQAAQGSLTGAGKLMVSGGTVNFAKTLAFTGDLELSSGTARFEENQTISNFSLSGGTLSGAGNVTVSGVLNWSAGTLGVGGELVVEIGATANVLDGSTKGLNRVFRNRGTVNHTTANSVFLNFSANTSARIENEPGGVWIVDGEGDYPHSSGGTNAFNNAGSFVQRGGTTSFSSFVPFNNTGSVAVESGTLVLGGGGSNVGTFVSSAGSTVDFSGGSFVHGAGSVFNPEGAFRGSGGTVVFDEPTAAPEGLTISGGDVTFNQLVSGANTLVLSGGTVRFGVDQTFSNFTHSGGTLSGAGTVTVTGVFDWSAGTLGTGGELVIETDATANILNGSTKGLNRIIRNRGTVNHATANSVFFNLSANTSARIENESGGVWIVDGEGDYQHSSGGTNAFNNAGSFIKRGGTTSFSSFVPLNNTGSLALESGALQLGGGGSNDGGINLTAGSTLVLSNGTFAQTAGGSLTGAGDLAVSGATVSFAAASGFAGNLTFSSGTIRFGAAQSIANFTHSGGTLSGAGTVTATGVYDWSGGALGLGGELVIEAGATANILNGSTKGLNRVFRNRGTVNHTTANNVFFNLSATTSARIENEPGAVWTVDGEGDYPHSSGGTNAFNNAGSFIKRGGTTSFSSFATFNNSGDVVVEGGTLRFDGAFTQTDAGADMDLAGGNLSSTTLTFAAGRVSGVGTLTANVTNAGATFAPSGTGSRTLAITGSYTQQAGGSLELDLDGVAASDEFDKLTVSASATFNGTVNLRNSVSLTGEVFTLLTHGSSSGTFPTITVTNGGNATATYLGNRTDFTVTADPPLAAFGWFDAALSALTDSDGDGVCDLIERAFGCEDGVERRVSGSSVVIDGARYPMIHYWERRDGAPFGYRLQYSHDLRNWFDADGVDGRAGSLEVSRAPEGAFVDAIDRMLSLPLQPESSVFLRLDINYGALEIGDD